MVERIELIEGEIVAMAPIGPTHAGIVDLLADHLREQLGRRAIVRVQNPLRLSPRSEPRPDLVVLRPRPDFYARAHPGSRDALLVVEVAESSLAYDRDVKVPLYARAGIPEGWVVDTAGRRTFVHTALAQDRYTAVREVAADAPLSPEAFPDVSLDLGAIWA